LIFADLTIKTGGFRPASRVHFLCIDKENGTKRKQPQCHRLTVKLSGSFRSVDM